jgi:hypothetical protein
MQAKKLKCLNVKALTQEAPRKIQEITKCLSTRFSSLCMYAVTNS